MGINRCSHQQGHVGPLQLGKRQVELRRGVGGQPPEHPEVAWQTRHFAVDYPPLTLEELAVTGALYPLAIQYGYGEIWFRPGLDLRRRTLVTVAAFTALKLDGQIRKFGQSALNMGVSKTEVIEAIIQTAPLTGFAPALNALGSLSEALK